MHCSGATYRLALTLWLLLPTSTLFAQAAPPPTAPPAAMKVPKIADQPRSIDPASFLPDALTAKATVSFSEASLDKVVDWLRKERKLKVTVDERARDWLGLKQLTVNDRLNNAPVYLLLNRLDQIGLVWHTRQGSLSITADPSNIIAAQESDHALISEVYSLKDLREAGVRLRPGGVEFGFASFYPPGCIFPNENQLIWDLQALLGRIIDPNGWEELGGMGAMKLSGDALFVRNTQRVQLQIKGLLAALRNLGRQTFVDDPPDNQRLRDKLREEVSVRFVKAPLMDVVQIMAHKHQLDLRIDKRDVEGEDLTRPVSIDMESSRLDAVLERMLRPLSMTWCLRDGVVWVSTRHRAQESQLTAVYDVRDLCRNREEGNELAEVILSQTTDSWSELGFTGELGFAKTGVLVICNSELVHEEVASLLKRYRAMLEKNPRGAFVPDDPQQIVTRYYRLHTPVAKDLKNWLPKSIRPETWQSERNPDASGEITILSSNPDVTSKEARLASTGEVAEEKIVEITSRSVLVIRHTREAHEEIVEVIRRVEGGDSPTVLGFSGGGLSSTNPIVGRRPKSSDKPSSASSEQVQWNGQ